MGLRQRNILSLLEDRTNNYNDRVALGIKNALGWREFTYKGVGLMSRKLAWHLINVVGVKRMKKLLSYQKANRNTELVYLRQSLLEQQPFLLMLNLQNTN